MRVLRVAAAMFLVLVFAAVLAAHWLAPEGYAVFGETALLPWLSALWGSFVMPNIGWLTIVLGIFEIAVGLGMLWRRTARAAAWGMLAFLIFITTLGYGFPTSSFGEDLLKNRVITIAMSGLLVPLLFAGGSSRDPS